MKVVDWCPELLHFSWRPFYLYVVWCVIQLLLVQWLCSAGLDHPVYQQLQVKIRHFDKNKHNLDLSHFAHVSMISYVIPPLSRSCVFTPAGEAGEDMWTTGALVPVIYLYFSVGLTLTAAPEGWGRIGQEVIILWKYQLILTVSISYWILSIYY